MSFSIDHIPVSYTHLDVYKRQDIYGGKLNAEGYKSVAKQLADKFHFEKVAITLRESHSAFDNGWSAMLYDCLLYTSRCV